MAATSLTLPVRSEVTCRMGCPANGPLGLPRDWVRAAEGRLYAEAVLLSHRMPSPNGEFLSCFSYRK